MDARGWPHRHTTPRDSTTSRRSTSSQRSAWPDHDRRGARTRLPGWSSIIGSTGGGTATAQEFVSVPRGTCGYALGPHESRCRPINANGDQRQDPFPIKDFTVWTTLESEAVATLENSATQTDWMGDLGGGLGVDPAAGGGRGSAAAGREGSGHCAGDGGCGGAVGPSAAV
jgi:hypothetical protein